MTNAETQLAGFFALYEPTVARLGKALRKRLRARLPGWSEIVYRYEKQGSLVIAYSATERGYEALCSLAVHPDRVLLYFTNAPQLAEADPDGLLQGKGKSARYVVLHTAADLDRPPIEALMVAALARTNLRPVAGAKGTVIVKADEQRQRAARTKPAGRSKQPRH